MTATAANYSDDRQVRANIFRLAAAQALAGANSTVIFATGAIVGSILAPNPAYATVPITTFVIGTALATLPSGWISRLYGRNRAFMLGTGSGIITGLLGALAIYWGSFWLYCLASLFGGFYNAVAQSFRFAATDGAPPAFRPKAISWVMTGGIFAAFLGPQVVQLTMNYWSPYLFAASYTAQAAIALINMILLMSVKLPKPVAADMKAGRPLLEIVRQPRFVAAALCGVISYSLMNLIMTSAPLAMKMCGLSLSDSNLGIQWHVLAMFGPSFFTGALITRYGAQTIVAVGLALIAIGAAIGLMGLGVAYFWADLILLGIGWNFGFVGASAMVVETHRPEERNKVQAFNDFVIFGFMAVTSFSSGQILTSFGWDMVNWVAFPPIAFGLVLLAVAAFNRRRARAVMP